jgi:hypothetical protein
VAIPPRLGKNSWVIRKIWDWSEAGIPDVRRIAP